MQLYLELYTAEADFSFNVNITDKELFKTVFSIKSSRWFQFNWKSAKENIIQQKQEIKNNISWYLFSENWSLDANFIKNFNFKHKTHKIVILLFSTLVKG
jgi:hypothetical protein